MKQFVLDTSYIIPTGDKKKPVVIAPTYTNLYLSLFGVVCSVLTGYIIWQKCYNGSAVKLWGSLLLVVIPCIIAVIHIFKPENPCLDFRTYQYVNLQQYALHIWRTRCHLLMVSLGTLMMGLSYYHDDLIYVSAFIIFILFPVVSIFFSIQIKQAKHIPNDLGLQTSL